MSGPASAEQVLSFSSAFAECVTGRPPADVEPWRPPTRNPQDPMGMWAPPPRSPYPLQPKQAWITPEDQSRVLDARYFLDCIQKGRPSDVSAEVAAAATTTLMAAYRSAAAGRVVAIP